MSIQAIEYALVRSRRKTLAIHVKAGGIVEVRAPLRLAKGEIERFVASKTPWIRSHLARFEAMPAPVAVTPQWGAKIRVFGEEWPLVRRGFGNGTQREVELRLGWDATPAQFQVAVDRWYARIAQAWLAERHDYWRTHMLTLGLGLPASRVSVRKMKRRWGSCRRNGNILFNSHLLKYPPDSIDCVVVHELCHLVHFNHSADFYALMSRVMPGWKSADALLRDHALQY